MDSDSNHEMKRWLLLERKAMTNLDSKLKSRKITAIKGLSSQSNLEKEEWNWRKQPA